jgi:hypothetical protein
VKRFLAQLVAAVVLIAAVKAPHPVRILVSPRVGVAPLLVQVRVSLPQPNEDWTCPEVEIEWPDERSKAKVDCDPEDPVFTPFIRSKWLVAGEWEVVVRVKQGINQRVDRQTIRVLG